MDQGLFGNRDNLLHRRIPIDEADIFSNGSPKEVVILKNRTA